MSAKIVALPTEQRAIPEVVEFVEAVLVRCKAGDTIAVAFVEVWPDGTIATGHVNKTHFNCLTGGAARLLHLLTSSPADSWSDKPT